MPNSVFTRLQVTGAEAKVQEFVRRAIRRGCGEDDETAEFFEFDRFVPMPDTILEPEAESVLECGFALRGYTRVDPEDPRSGIHEVGMEEPLSRMLDLPWVKEAGIHTWRELEERLRKDNPVADYVGRMAVNNFEKYGAFDFETWCLKHWGTVWNAGEYSIIDRSEGMFSCVFVTVSLAPIPVYKAIDSLFPALNLDIAWLEVASNFAGSYVRPQGEVAEVREIFDIDLDGDPEAAALFEKVNGYPVGTDIEEILGEDVCQIM